MPNRLPPDMLQIRLDTRDDPRAELVLDLAQAILADLRNLPGMPRDVDVTLHRLGAGSTIVEFIVKHRTDIIALAGLAVSITTLWQGGGRETAAPVIHQTISNYGGTQVVIDARDLDEPIVIPIAQIVVPPEPLQPMTGSATGTVGAPLSPDSATQRVTSEPSPVEREILGSFTGVTLGGHPAFLANDGARYVVLLPDGTKIAKRGAKVRLHVIPTTIPGFQSGDGTQSVRATRVFH